MLASVSRPLGRGQGPGIAGHHPTVRSLRAMPMARCPPSSPLGAGFRPGKPERPTVAPMSAARATEAARQDVAVAS
jgi:hypothetical protein